MVRRGFTLLEVILALALSVIVVGAIGYAIYFHMRILEDQRARVEQALVARGLMQMIANDVRSTVQYKPVDMSQLEALLAGTDLASLLLDPAMAGAAADLDPALLEGAMGGGSDPAADEGQDASQDAAPAEPRPGLFGAASELRCDISRMPRRDQYLYGLSTDGLDVASDLRSVVYRLVPTDSLDPSQTVGLPPVTEPDSISLVRVGISHAVARLADETGTDLGAIGETMVLANGVKTLTFRYFDGEQGSWTESWDSESMESLPTAVEIVVALQPPVSAISGQVLPEESYRLVVHLPLAEPPASDDSGSSAETNGASGSGSSTNGSGAGGGS